MRKSIEDALKRAFRPELLNRIDEIIIFDALTKDEIGRIIDLLLKDVRKRLEERKLEIELTQAAKDWLVEQGFDQVYGARPLRRAIQRHVENPLAKRVLAGEFKDGEHVLVDLKEGHLTFSAKRPVAAMR
jgi:ATP-dependent Clp protease ATP-binding subunit ClpC